MPAARMDLEIRAKNLATRALRDVQREMTALGRGTASMARSIMANFGRMASFVGRQLFSLKGAIAAIGLGLLARGFVKTAEEMQVFHTQLVTVLGSVKAADKAIRDIITFAAKTPFEIPQIVETRIQLESVGISGMETIKIVGNTAAAMGRDIRDVSTALISMEREVLRRYGIDVRRQGDQATFIWRDVTGKMVETTAEGSDAIIRQTLLSIWNQKYEGGMERFSKTWKGMMSNLADWWTQFRDMIMKAGVFDALQKGLKAILDWIDKLAAEGKLQRWAKDIGSFILKTFKAIADSGYYVTRAVEEITVAFVYAWGIVKETFKLEWFQRNIIEPAKTAVFWIGDKLKRAWDLLADTVKTSGIVETIVNYSKASEDAAKTREYFQAISGTFGKMSIGLQNILDSLEKMGPTATEATGALVKGMDKATESVAKLSKQQMALSEKLTEYFLSPVEKLEYEYEKMLEIAGTNAELRLKVENWYTKELYELIGKRLKEQMDADLKRAKSQKKTLEEMRKNDLAFNIAVIKNAASTQDQIEKAWRNIRRIVEEQNIGMVRGFKLGWTDALNHFRTVGHRFYELGRDTAQKLHESFSDYFFDAMMGNIRSMKDAWKSFCDYLKQAFLRAVADMAAAEITTSLFGGGDKKGTKDGGGVWDWLGLIGQVGGGLSTAWDWLGSAWDWISGWFHSGGSVGRTGLYSLEGGEYVVPREQVAMFKGVFGSGNLDKVLGGRSGIAGRRGFQQGGEVPEDREGGWIDKFLMYLQRVKGVKWVWDKILAPAFGYGGGAAGAGMGAAGMYMPTGGYTGVYAGGYMGGGVPAGYYPGAYQGAYMGGGTTGYYGQPTGTTTGLWGTVSPYLTAAGLGYMGGSMLGSYLGPRWFGTSGQYGGYGGALGAAGGYAVGTSGAVSGTALGASLGTWAGPVGAIIGGILGTVLGSAIGPEAHKTRSAVRYNISALQLLNARRQEDWPGLDVSVSSTHGKTYAYHAGVRATAEIYNALHPSLLKYQSILRGIPYAEGVAKEMPDFNLGRMIGGLQGGRKAHFGSWITSAKVIAPDLLKGWWDLYAPMALYKMAGKYPDVYGPTPEKFLEGKHWTMARLGWGEAFQEVPYSGYYQRGGFVKRTGLAFVHKGEEIVPESQTVEKRQQNFNITFDIRTVDATDFDRLVRRKIQPKLEDLIKRHSHMRYTIKEAV